MDVVRIPVSDTTNFGGRTSDAATVAMLAESMAAVGLLNPIIVAHHIRHSGPVSISAYQVIAGRHRLEAARKLAWSEIDAVVVDLDPAHAELCEIDENLIRNELTPSQRASAHARREEIMVGLGLAKTHGGVRGQVANSATCSYAKQTADALGVSARTVRQDLQRGKNIDPDVLAEVSGTDLDKGVVLDQLAAVPPDQQSAKLASLRAEREAREQEAKEVQRRNRSVDVLHSQDACETAARMVVGWADYNGLTQLIALISDRRMSDFVAALRREMSEAPVMDKFG